MNSSAVGTPSIHRLAVSKWITCWLLFVIVGMVGGLVVIGGISIRDGSWVPGAVVIGLAFVCLLPAFWALVSRPVRAEVHPDHLVWTTLGKRHQVAWEDIISVHYSETGDKQPWYSTVLTLTFADGTKVVFDQTLTRFRKMAEAVHTAAAERKLVAAEEQVRRGPVPFGPLYLTDQGVLIQNRTLPWETIQHWVDERYLILVPRGEVSDAPSRYQVPLGDIPNVQLLLDLMTRLENQRFIQPKSQR